MINQNKLLSFLYFGFIPQSKKEVFQMLNVNEGSLRKKNLSLDYDKEEKWKQHGVQVLKEVFHDQMAEVEEKKHVLPLSGGVDSRAILGGLLENVNSSQIETVTFGTPGTWDYEIGQLVAKKFGIKNYHIDLTELPVTTESLVEAVKSSIDTPEAFDSFYNYYIKEKFGSTPIFWSGIGGDALGSAHLHLNNTSLDLEDTMKVFMKNYRATDTKKILKKTEKKTKKHLKSVILDYNTLRYLDRLIFSGILAGHEAPILLHTDFKIKTPFLSKEWLQFILNLSNKYREEEKLYKGIVAEAYPNLFSLPTSSNLGLSLNSNSAQKFVRKSKLRMKSLGRKVFPNLPWGPKPNLNYIDFDKGIRERDDLKQLVYENIQDLKRRNIVEWLDIDSIWQRHQNGEANHGNTLTLLTSLEINLKAQEDS